MNWYLYGWALVHHTLASHTDHPHQVSATPPLDGSRDEYSSLLSVVRSMRDAYYQKRSEISRELSTTQHLTRLHEKRLDHTIEALSAIEDLLGEIRARFRAKGIPVTDPRYLPPYRMSDSTAIESGVTTEPSADSIVPRADGMDLEVSVPIFDNECF